MEWKEKDGKDLWKERKINEGYLERNKKREKMICGK